MCVCIYIASVPLSLFLDPFFPYFLFSSFLVSFIYARKLPILWVETMVLLTNVFISLWFIVSGVDYLGIEL